MGDEEVDRSPTELSSSGNGDGVTRVGDAGVGEGDILIGEGLLEGVDAILVGLGDFLMGAGGFLTGPDVRDGPVVLESEEDRV